MRANIWVSALWVIASCDLEPRCDKGQKYELGSCITIPVAQDAAIGDADVPDAASCKPGPGHYEGFGAHCEDNTDCRSCVAPICASAPLNVCSRLNCQDDPQACPPGWSCTDISMFSNNPSITHLCIKL